MLLSGVETDRPLERGRGRNTRASIPELRSGSSGEELIDSPRFDVEGNGRKTGARTNSWRTVRDRGHFLSGSRMLINR